MTPPLDTLDTLADLWSGDPPRRGHPEADLQRQVHQFLSVALPSDAVHFAVPNGLVRSRKTREIAKGQGVTAGVPDLCIVHRGRALFVELKTARGALSEDQRQMHRRLTYAGADVVVCRSPECVETSLLELGVPLRASLAAWPPRRVYLLERELVP